MKLIKLVKNPNTRLFANLFYALGNCIVGIYLRSWWFITAGAYYSVLTVARFFVLRTQKKSNGNIEKEFVASRITGILLVAMSFCIVGVNVLSAVKERGSVLHEIIMISVAAYTFTKITIALVGMVKARHNPSPIIKTLRNISLSDACVSIYTMQRSMLVTFQGLEKAEIKLLNIFTGTAVWIIILLLGINLIGGKYTVMAKSKIIKATEKIAETVTDGYKKIENGVVGGYKKIEQGVVDGYKKIEDKFVDSYLTKDGETVEEAKERLKRETK